MKTDVSTMTMSTGSLELEPSTVLFHQFLESAERHDLPQCNMHRFGPRFNSESFRGFIRQARI
jgi:hypothetical protein